MATAALSGNRIKFSYCEVGRAISLRHGADKHFDQEFYHKDPWHVQVFESEKVQQLADLKRQELVDYLSYNK